LSDQETVSSLIDVGFGVSQVLPVITALYAIPEGEILLIEQPELHLHPLAQSALADLMLEVAHERNIQLIVESHSEHILRRFQRRTAEGAYPAAAPERLKLYFATRQQGASVMNPVEITPYGQIKNWPEHFFGDVSGDLENMMKAGLDKRRKEIANRG
jgi:predicted ATPase